MMTASNEENDWALVWNNLGRSFICLHKHEEALEALDRAIEINPKYAMAWYNKGYALWSLSRYNECMDAFSIAKIRFDEAIKINPQDELSWYFKGKCDQKMESGHWGLESFDRVIEINPRNADAWYNRGIALSVGDGDIINHNEADKSFNKAKEINPHVGAKHRWIG